MNGHASQISFIQVIVFVCVFIYAGAFSAFMIRGYQYKNVLLPALAEEKGANSVSILNFGDIMFDRGVRLAMRNGTNPFSYVSDQSFFKEADLVVANLEGPITESEVCQKKAYSFKFSPRTAELLSNSGIDIVNLSNNHSFDCFHQGIVDTRENLDLFKVGYFGGGMLSESYKLVEVKGKKIAFVGIDETIQTLPTANFYPLISQLKSQNDYVVVNIHWGTEYSKVATAVQTEIGHHLIDSGADVVFGHHPHVIEPVEIYKNKVIFYSLGNFIFDQQTKETNEGIGARVEFGSREAVFTIFPYAISTSMPRFLPEGNDRDNFCSLYLRDIPKSEDCSFTIIK